MNIATVLEAQAHRVADRPAIVERAGRVSFAELNRAAASAAADLRRAGVRAGMRALVFSPMSIALYTTMIALFRLRATAVFVDPSAGRERLDRSVRRLRPDAFVAVPRAHWLRLTSPAIRAIAIKAAIGGGVPLTMAVAGRVSGERAAVEPCDPETPDGPSPTRTGPPAGTRTSRVPSPEREGAGRGSAARGLEPEGL